MWLLFVLLTIIPIGLIILFIYNFNEHAKESPFMLGLLFIGGWLSFVLVRLTSNFLDGRVYELSSSSPFLKNNWEFFLVAFGMIAVVEELSKFIMLNIFCYRSNKFQNIYDGIVYGVMISLGFAFIENIMYLQQQGLGIALSRSIFTIPAHASFGVIMGYYLGIAKVFSLRKMGKDSLKYRYIAFFVPLVLHGIYDYICNFNVNGAYYVLIAFTIFLYILAIIKLSKTNKTNIAMYDNNKYQSDDITMDYQDDLTAQSDEIRKRLFEKQQQGTFNNETKQYEVNNFDIKMFAGDEEDNHNE